MGTLSGEGTLPFSSLSPFYIRISSDIKKKNLLLREKILFFTSKPQRAMMSSKGEVVPLCENGGKYGGVSILTFICITGASFEFIFLNMRYIYA